MATLGLVPLAGLTDLAMAITGGSSISTALLATPVLVFAGALINLEGESTWLEGVLLCAFYLILAVDTFFAPA